MKRSIIIAGALVASSVIFSADKLYTLSQSQNTLNLTSGKVRLGEVYSEKLTTSYQVKFKDSSQLMVDVQGNTQDIYQIAYDDFVSTIEAVNKDRESSKKELLSLDNANWTKNATITMITKVTYQSQFQPNFVLTINETKVDYQADDQNKKNINSYLSDLRSYAIKMEDTYKEQNTFI
jgi:hypothetical protein